MNKRYFLYFSYNGTAYHGWQIQPNGISVQEIVCNCMSTVLRTKIQITGAGRTDTGVHAKLMVAHFDLESTLYPEYNLLDKLNSILPHDISIHKIIEVIPTAHARFDAISRSYEYHVVTKKDVFKKGFAAQINDKLDFESMNKAAQLLLKHSDFTSFSKLHTDVKTNICLITHAEWTQLDDEWVFKISANRFLRNMVRAIVGTLFEVGNHKMSVDEFRAVIEAKNRCRAGVSVPAHGLYLVDIQYPIDIFM